MRTFSEERKMRTEQMLMTAPISITGMVMGKFLAAMTIYAGCLAASCVNLIPLYVMGKRESNPDEGVVAGPVTPEVVGSLLGVLLVGAVFIAIGILISSMTENQLSAAVVTIAVLAVMLILNMLNSVGSEEEGTRLINNYVARYIIDWVSVVSRFNNFQYGILDWSALLYYVSMTFIAIYLTVRVYERRRWA
jgi:ABC-2 type transport system permease protein